MLQGGTVSSRVEQAMNRVALALGADRLDAYITLTGITASLHCRKRHYTQITRVTSVRVDMNWVSAVEFLSKNISTTATIAELNGLLDEIEQMPPVYPIPWVIAAVAIACGAFALIQGGSIAEFIGAAIGAGFGQAVRLKLRIFRLNLIPTTMICAAIATLLCYPVMQAARAIALPAAQPTYGLLSSVLFLVPGMHLITAALDLIRFDLVSGLSRVTYALLLLFNIAVGILFAGMVLSVNIF